jgi:hypothetical protein
MARRIPMPVLGPLALSLTSVLGCAEDPLVGAWTVTELDEEAMPYMYESYYGDVEYSASMRIFEDMVGYVAFHRTAEGESTLDYDGEDLTIVRDINYSSLTRVWARATGENTYILVGEGDELNCSLTLPTLSCVDNSDDDVMSITLVKDADQ